MVQGLRAGGGVGGGGVSSGCIKLVQVFSRIVPPPSPPQATLQKL